MLIGIISDTHDQLIRTESAVRKLKAEGAEVLFHCGDVVRPHILAVCSAMPFYLVFGNNDSAPALGKAIQEIDTAVSLDWGGDVELAGKRIAMSHGHLPKEFRRLLAAEPDYMFSGHTHVAYDSREGKTRWINPGALHRASQYSVALLNLENDELRYLEVAR